MPEYTAAPEAEKIAERLIAQHHSHLTDVRVEFVFRDKAAKKHGKVVLGTARKVSGLNSFLARRTEDGEDTDGAEFFVIEIAKDEWDPMPPSKRRALVDHELCHCTIDFDEEKDIVTLGIRAHDVEEFAEIVERHGLWKDDLAEFAKAVKEQLDLGLGIDDMSVTISYIGEDGEERSVDTSASAIEDAAHNLGERP